MYEKDRQSSSTITIILIAPIVFVIFAVAVQAILLRRGFGASKEGQQTVLSEFPLRRHEEQASVGCVLDMARTGWQCEGRCIAGASGHMLQSCGHDFPEEDG